MAKFLDGPAGGVSLGCRRAPLLLRAVFNPRARKAPWDALDLLEDAPKPHEKLTAYRRVSEPVRYHVLYGGSPRRGAWFTDADYRVVDPQPADEVLGDTNKWRAWCAENAKENDDG